MPIRDRGGLAIELPASLADQHAVFAAHPHRVMQEVSGTPLSHPDPQPLVLGRSANRNHLRRWEDHRCSPARGAKFPGPRILRPDEAHLPHKQVLGKFDLRKMYWHLAWSSRECN